MNISKEQFTKLAKEHLLALESYKMDKNGNKPVEIFGIEKLYEAINFIQCCVELKCGDCDCKIKYENIGCDTLKDCKKEW
mgnify:CR=1 FL=1